MIHFMIVESSKIPGPVAASAISLGDDNLIIIEPPIVPGPATVAVVCLEDDVQIQQG